MEFIGLGLVIALLAILPIDISARRRGNKQIEKNLKELADASKAVDDSVKHIARSLDSLVIYDEAAEEQEPRVIETPVESQPYISDIQNPLVAPAYAMPLLLRIKTSIGQYVGSDLFDEYILRRDIEGEHRLCAGELHNTVTSGRTEQYLHSYELSAIVRER